MEANDEAEVDIKNEDIPSNDKKKKSKPKKGKENKVKIEEKNKKVEKRPETANVSKKEKKKKHKSDVIEEIKSNQDMDEKKGRVSKKPFWITRDMAQDFGREQVIKSILREAFLYVLFVIFITIHATKDSTSSRYFLTRHMKERFIIRSFPTAHGQTNQFEEINEIQDVFHYMQTLLVNNFYTMGFTTTSDDLRDREEEYFSNVLLAVPRIRQVRMPSDSCVVAEYFKNKIKKCFLDYKMLKEDTEPFGLRQAPAWVYNHMSVTKSVTTIGTLATYGGGGYYVDFPRNRMKYMALIEQLRNNLWIDRGTRAVFIDFAFYNSNVDLFVLYKLIFETPSSGGVIPSYKIIVTKYEGFPDKINYFDKCLEIIILIYIVIFTLETIRNLVYFKKAFFLKFFSYIDLFIVMLGYLMLLVDIFNTVTTRAALREIRNNPNVYGNLESAGMFQTTNDYLLATIVFVTYIKLFKYININKSMCQLNYTLNRCLKDICAFSILFLLVFVAFALPGYLIFGRQAASYRSFGKSIFTLLRTILGDFDYSEIEKVTRVVAPIFFIMFMFVVFFILLNMFLAIVTDAYSDVKIELSLSVHELSINDYVKLKIAKFLKKLHINLKLQMEELDAYDITLQKIKDVLQRFKFSDMEIQMFFARYNIDTNARIQRSDIEQLKKELENPQPAPNAAPKSAIGFLTNDDFEKQQADLRKIKELANRINEQLKDLVNHLKSKSERINP